jgi:hypothetical protein
MTTSTINDRESPKIHSVLEAKQVNSGMITVMGIIISRLYQDQNGCVII